MSKTSRILLACALALAAAACAPAPRDDPDTAQNVLLLPVADDPTISFAVYFKVGSLDDPAGKEGLAALTGGLLAEGATTENSYQDILDKLYPIASSYAVRVDKEMTTFTGRTHRDTLEAFFELFADAYLSPGFTQPDFERLRDDRLNSLEKTLRYSSDEELAKAALTELIFEGTGYRHPSVGTLAGLRAISRDDVRDFYQSRFTRDNAVVALAGGYPEDLVERFRATLDRLPEGAPATTPAPSPAAIEGRQVILVAKPGADASISFGYPIDVRRGSREFYALWLANSWLGEHRSSSSHLFQVIRELRGLNYGDYSYIEAYPDAGRRMTPPTGVGRRQQIFEVWIRTLPNQQAHFALRAAIRELDQLIRDGIDEEAFELTRSFLRKYHLHFAETTQARLGYRVDDLFYGLDSDGHLARFGRMMDELTRDEVNAAIRKYLQTDNLKIAIVTGDAKGLAQSLTNDAPSPITYDSEKSEDVLTEDKEIESYPLGIAADAVRVVPVEEIFNH